MAEQEPTKKLDPAEQRAPLDLEREIREKVLTRDARYDLNAYAFVYEALAFTQKLLGRDMHSEDPKDRHVTGQELVEGIRQCALEQFGPLAPTVFRSWGVRRTEDFGEIVFNLVESGLMGKTESDGREDFRGGYDFDEAFGAPLSEG